MEDHSAPKESQQQGQVAVRPAERKLDVLSVLLLVLQKLRTLLRGSRTHLLNVLANLRNFAARVPYKYRGSIEKAICSLYDRLILLFLQLKPRLLCMMQALKTEGSVGSMHA